MRKPSPQSENAKIIAAALRLAASKGWPHVTLDAVAKEAKISPATIKKRFASSPDLIPVIVGEITRESLAAAEKTSGRPHDILFALMMARFDALQKNREAILSIAEAARHDRTLACALTRATLKSMAATAEAARLVTPPRPVLAGGLSAVYAWAFLAWRKDKTRDMAKTMAALDKALRMAGKTAMLFKPHP